MPIPARSILELAEPPRARATVRKMDTNSFLYQELNIAVLVWHAACIREGQKPVGNVEVSETGKSLLHRERTEQSDAAD